MYWTWIVFDGAKSHACPEYLARAVKDDLIARGAGEGYTKGLTRMYLDAPGMIVTTRPHRIFVLDGLEIEIPCEDVGSFIVQLQGLPVRTFTEGQGIGVGMSYYKLHAFCKCLVLTPDQHYIFTEMLQRVLPECELAARVFYADRVPISQVLREANAAASGKPVEAIPDCGAHKTDRFHTKKGLA